MKSFWKRTLTGVILITLIIGALLLGAFTFLALCFLLNVLGLLELYRMFRIQNTGRKTSAILLSGWLFLSAALVIAGRCNANILILSFPLIAVIFMAELGRKSNNRFVNLAFIFLGIIYVTVPFILLFASAFIGDGQAAIYKPNIIIGYFFMLWANDSGAYVFGTLFGKHHLSPGVSPNKTWEGSAGGGLLVMVVAYINHLFINPISLGGWMVIGGFVIVTGTLGDLVKSLMKRSVNIKDCGNILPGHGGILDRFDSLIGSIPFVITYLVFFA